MTDAALNYFVSRGTAAARALFTPSHATPPAGPSQCAVWYETDTGDFYAWDGSAWDKVSEATSLTAINALTGDVTATGPGSVAATIANDAVTTAKILNANVTPAKASTQLKTKQITIVIDGGGSVITTGVKGFVSCPYTGTITGARLLSTDASATSGSIVIDIWKDTYANYPPTVADTITAAAKPTLSSATKSDDTTLTGWTTSVTAGDILGFKVDSATTVTKVTLQLTIVLS